MTQPSFTASQMVLEIVLHIAQCPSHAAAKYSSSAKNWLHCRAIKVKYYPLLPNPQANTAAGEGQQGKNDIMKPKRESKHHASSMRRSETCLFETLTSVLSVCSGEFFWTAIKHGCATHHSSQRDDLTLACFSSPGCKWCATSSPPCHGEAISM